MPAFSSAARIAGAGPMPMREGSTPTTARRRCGRAASTPAPAALSAVERIIIAAPSTMPEALPAVTKPSLSNAVGRLARSSIVVSGRRWSSCSIIFARFPFPTSTGTTSSASRPAAQASPARCWERQRELVLLLAGDAVVAGQVVRRLRHVEAAVGVEQGDHQEVLELPLAELEALARAADDVRRLRHVLHAAGEAGRGVAGEDRLGAGDDGLDAGAAEAVDGERRHLLGHAGLERHVARAVDGVARGLQRVADDGVVDLLPARCRCARAGRAPRAPPRSIAVTSVKWPLYSAIGVRAPSTRTRSRASISVRASVGKSISQHLT